MVPTGCSSLDRLLKGGFPINGLSLIYGEAETGKTTLATQCALYSARKGYKTIFVDSDGVFSTRRLSQIAHYDLEKNSHLIILIRPTTFQEQAFTIDHLDEYLSKYVGLIVVDTVTSLYRVELGSSERSFTLNRELNRQIACLAQLTKTHKVATIITSQVRDIFIENQVGVEPVANRVLSFWSNVVTNLKRTGQTGIIKALLEKHPERKRTVSCYLRIEETGIRDYNN